MLTVLLGSCGHRAHGLHPAGEASFFYSREMASQTLPSYVSSVCPTGRLGWLAKTDVMALCQIKHVLNLRY